MPSGHTHIDMTLAVLTTLGGVIGYVKKKSLPSLIGGCVFGLSYAATAYLIQVRPAYLTKACTSRLHPRPRK